MEVGVDLDEQVVVLRQVVLVEIEVPRVDLDSKDPRWDSM